MNSNLFVSCPPPLGHSWISNTELGIFSTSPTGSKNKLSPSIQEVKWGTPMTCDEFMRRLTKTSYESCEDIDEARAIHLASEADLVQVFEVLWHLAELIFIQVSPSGHLSYNLCSWFYVQSQEAANKARQFLEKASEFQPNQRSTNAVTSIERDTQFWPTVLTLVLQGRSQEAASLLILHSHSNSRGLRSLRQLLAAMPFVSPTKGEGSWTETGALFSQAWNYWQSECENRLASGEFDHVGGDLESIDYVKLIVSILAGRQSVWTDPRIVQVTGGSRGWYFRFAAFVFYTDQLVATDGLSSDLNRWLSLSPQDTNDLGNALDQTVNELITSIFRLDLFSFLRISSEKLSNWWLVAHFTNLMNRVCPGLLSDFHTNQEQNISTVQNQKQESNGSTDARKLLPTMMMSRNPEVSSLTEFLLLGYVESLASDASLLNVTLGYLDYCETGRMRQSALLLRHGFSSSTRITNWLIGQARNRGLNTTAEQLARVASRRLLPLALKDNGHSGSRQSLSGLPSCAALGWALLARDHCIINRIAELALARDCGFLVKSESDDPLPESPINSTEVAELAAVVLSFCRESNSKQAAEVTDGSVPKHSSNTGQLNRFGLSPELAFLVRYAELQQCFSSGDCEGAMDRLIDLLVTSPTTSSPCHMDKSSPSSDGLNNLFSGSTNQIGIHIPTRLRLRLLAEVRHLLGQGCLRRDQIELLITALIELRSDLDSTPDACGPGTFGLLSKIHASLARELAYTFFPSENALRSESGDLTKSAPMLHS